MNDNSPPIPVPGEIVAGRYEIAAVIGRGGGGVVYRARQLGINRDVAMKVLPPESQLHASAVRRFEREARLVARLRHPNTVTLYEFNRTQTGLLYIVMEFVDGVPLKAVLEREGQIPPNRAVPIFRQVLKSLAEAHSHGIVHRDLKPANIMLCNLHGERDFVKVLDFGVATVLEADDQLFDDDMTRTADVVGTPKYMAPEQFRSGTLTAASDLYATACIAFEMLAGYCPFDGETLHVTIAKHLFQPAPKLPDFLSRYPNLVATIERLLEKTPETRFQTAEAVLESLTNWEAGVPDAKPYVATMPTANDSYVEAYKQEAGPGGLPHQMPFDATPQPGSVNSVTNNGLRNDISSRYGQHPLQQGYTATPSHPIYPQDAVNAGDTNPNMMVLSQPRSSGDARTWLLLGMVFTVIVLAAVAFLILTRHMRGKDTQSEDASGAAEATEHSDPSTASNGHGLEMSSDSLDRISTIYFATDQGSISCANGFVEGSSRAKPAAKTPIPKELPKDPVKTDPVVKNDPVKTDPVVKNDPVKTDPVVKNDPVKTDPVVKNDPVTTDPVVKNDPVKTGPDKDDPAKTAREYTRFSFKYQPPNCKVKVSGAKESSCKAGVCKVRAAIGTTLSIEVSAEGRPTLKKSIKVTKEVTVDTITLYRRSN